VRHRCSATTIDDLELKLESARSPTAPDMPEVALLRPWTLFERDGFLIAAFLSTKNRPAAQFQGGQRRRSRTRTRSACLPDYLRGILDRDSPAAHRSRRKTFCWTGFRPRTSSSASASPPARTLRPTDARSRYQIRRSRSWCIRYDRLPARSFQDLSEARSGVMGSSSVSGSEKP
jgi:hypothetical protein